MRVAGFGFRGGATVASLRDAYARAGGGADILATLEGKAGEPAFAEFARTKGLRVVALAKGAVQGVVTPTISERIMERFGTGSVAEAVALVAAGPGARLLTPRVKSEDGMATAAIAERNDE